jgi:hypothetical protein
MSESTGVLGSLGGHSSAFGKCPLPLVRVKATKVTVTAHTNVARPEVVGGCFLFASDLPVDSRTAFDVRRWHLWKARSHESVVGH